MAEQITTKRVFISYSWTSEEHVDWVVSLSERLVGDGIDVVLDQWDLKEGHDKFVFMEQMVTDPTVEKVLAVCDRRYAEKADGREGGVGTESQIISPEVYAQVKQEKFIPILRERDDDGKEYLPVFFKGRKYVDFSEDDAYEEAYDKLMRAIYGRPERRKPQLGQPPAHLFIESSNHVKVAGKFERLKSAVDRGKPHTQAMLQDYLDTFSTAMEDFRVSQTKEDSEPFDEIIVRSIQEFTPYRNSFIDLTFLVANYMDQEETYDRLFAFLEEILPYKHRPNHLSAWTEEWFDNYRFILRELFLSFIAALIKSKRYPVAARFLDDRYHFRSTMGVATFEDDGIKAFNEYVRMLDTFRKDRLKLREHFVSASLMKERATHPKISFEDLLQTDILLFVRGFLPKHGSCEGWFPYTRGWASGMGTMELFAKATSRTGLTALQQLLHVKDLSQLADWIKELLANQSFRQLVSDPYMMPISWDRVEWH